MTSRRGEIAATPVASPGRCTIAQDSGVSAQAGRALDTGEIQLLLEAARLAEVGRLVASVIHDVSTPLASVALRAESLLHLLEEGGAGPASTERFPRYLRSILDDAFRCKEGLARLSTLTHPPGPIKGVVNLNALCGDILALFQYDAMRHRIRTELAAAPAEIAVSGRDGRLPHALAAVVRNAIEASPPGGRVVVETRVTETGFAAVTVTDDGPGFPAEAPTQLFDPFFTTKPPGRGRAGLGLTLCQDVVQTLGGAVLLESEPGRGARLTLRLPLASGPVFSAHAR
jgi:signal transduction histidine kinase